MQAPGSHRTGLSRAKLGLLCLSLVALMLLSCDVSNQLVALIATPTPTPTNTPTATPTATPTNTPTNTPRPTNTPKPTNTPIPPTAPPKPTNTPIPPTETFKPTAPPVVDLSSAVLMGKDLPAGFQALSAADLKQLNLSESDLAQAFSGASTTARPMNFTAFLNSNPQKFQIVLSFLLYPLTTLEKAAFDLQLANPDIALQSFGAGFTSTTGGAKPSLLPGMDKFGDKSIGFTTTMSSGGLALRMDMVIVSRGTAIEVLMSMYLDGVQPTANLADLAKILDARVAAALGLK
jgi:hypothetical protein